MKNHEFISYEEVPIVKREFIKGIYDELLLNPVNIITFEEKQDYIE